MASNDIKTIGSPGATSTYSIPTLDASILDQFEGISSDEEPSPQDDDELPEFSGDETEIIIPTASSSKGIPLMKSKPGMKSKKTPLSKLKKKVGSLVVPNNNKGKGIETSELVQEDVEAKGVKLSEEMLDKLMLQLEIEKGPEVASTIKREDLQKMVDTIGLNKKVLQGKQGLMGRGTKDVASHKFWSTQPVPKLGTLEELKEGPLEANKAADAIRQEPLALRSEFCWDTMDLNVPSQLKEVKDLLTGHYVEDEDASFRFDYSADFLEWALKPPGYVPDWHIGIRVAKTGKLIAFISGIPVELRVRAVTKKCTEINFLCVHKKLRSKRLAPILIQEVTRRTHLRGIFQAIYTAGVYLPTPIARCQYYHRTLNPKKLVETGFTSIPRHLTMARMTRYYKMHEEPTLPGLREMEKKDLKQVGRLLRAYLARMDMAPLLSNKDAEHFLIAGKGVDVGGKRVGQITWTYVVEDPVTHLITDMFSFYSLPSTAVKSVPLTHVNAAYLFYYATTACPSCSNLGDGSVATPITPWKEETPEERVILKERLSLVIGDALMMASKAGFDVFNALTIQDNSLFLEDLRFGRGDGFLHFYLYNYATKPIKGGIDASDGGSGVGVVML